MLQRDPLIVAFTSHNFTSFLEIHKRALTKTGLSELSIKTQPKVPMNHCLFCVDICFEQLPCTCFVVVL